MNTSLWQLNQPSMKKFNTKLGFWIQWRRYWKGRSETQNYNEEESKSIRWYSHERRENKAKDDYSFKSRGYISDEGKIDIMKSDKNK